MEIETAIESIQDLGYILKYHDYTEFFRAYLESEFSGENLEFYMEVQYNAIVVQDNTIQYNTIHYTTIQYNTGP